MFHEENIDRHLLKIYCVVHIKQDAYWSKKNIFYENINKKTIKLYEISEYWFFLVSCL